MYLLHCQTQCILGAQQINAGRIAKAPKVHIGFPLNPGNGVSGQKEQR